MNPFQSSIFETFKSFTRLLLWLSLAINLATLAFYSTLLTWHVCSFGWRWALRTIFSSEWGV